MHFYWLIYLLYVAVVEKVISMECFLVVLSLPGLSVPLLVQRLIKGTQRENVQKVSEGLS